MLDIDFFKQVNDRHGHATGDAVLRCFSAAARASLRANDVLARWGGEEFLLLLPDAAPEDARAVLERMAERVHAMAVPGLEGDRISFSAGLAARRAGEASADVISRADKAPVPGQADRPQPHRPGLVRLAPPQQAAEFFKRCVTSIFQGITDVHCSESLSFGLFPC